MHQTVGSDSVELPGESDLVRLVGDNDLSITGSRGFKQSTTRSNLVAKQVVSIQSALSLGFISQLWVDTTSVSSFLNPITLASLKSALLPNL